MTASEEIKRIYMDMYAGGAQAAWRDLGASDKASDVLRLWREAELPARPRVIEVGSGEGAVAAALARAGFFSTYRGFELSPSGVAQARNREISNTSFEVIDGRTIPTDDDSADVVLMSHVVEHLEHPRELIYEASRVARHVIIEVPLEATLRMPMDHISDDLGHINKYTPKTVRHLVQSCGLSIVGQFTMNPSYQVQTFFDSSGKRRLEWFIKERALKYFPWVAPNLFVYHEAILARRR